ncbi:hypothetical protein POZ19_10365 [Ralstonia wenshanensis]
MFARLPTRTEPVARDLLQHTPPDLNSVRRDGFVRIQRSGEYAMDGHESVRKLRVGLGTIFSLETELDFSLADLLAKVFRNTQARVVGAVTANKSRLVLHGLHDPLCTTS